MQVKVITWNLFHGRDAPPDPGLFTLRSRLVGKTERNATHVQVNRDLFLEFADVLSAADWDIALLQECPPRWAQRLARACGAERHRVLTSRNRLGSGRAVLARANPDLLGANEGGSNLTLVRAAGRPALTIVERRAVDLPERRPERRAMALTRLRDGLCIANLHAANDRPALAERQLAAAARMARRWAGSGPLLLGGDLNLRPRDSAVYSRLEEELGFSRPAIAGGIDHLLGAGIEVTGVAAWEPERRELACEGLALRLSDHAPVEATVTLPDVALPVHPAGAA